MKQQVLLMLFVVLGFSGCGAKAVYVDRPLEVKIPVPCKVSKVECASSQEMADMNDSAVVIECYRCVHAHKEAVKVCQP